MLVPLSPDGSRRSPTALKPAVALLLILALVSSAPLLARADDPSLEEILANYYEAIGGQDAWRAIKTMRQSGKMQMGPMEAAFTIQSASPNRMRMEFELQGMTGIQAFDGEKGWMVMPFQGSTDPEPMPQEMVDMIAADVDMEGVLIDYEEKGHQVELIGTEQIEGTDTYRLRLTLKNGHEMDFFLDAEYFIPIAMRAKNTLQGMEMEVETTLSDYKEVGGLMIPHSISAKTGMGEQVLTIESVEIDVEIDDSIFTMPEKEEAEKEDGGP